LDSIARALSISKTKLCSIAAREDTTVVSLINERRMKAAKNLLSHTDNHVAEISDLVGIKDYNYFSKLFRQHFGQSPSEYRKTHMRESLST
jgi:AraC-like DNA-binding protein